MIGQPAPEAQVKGAAFHSVLGALRALRGPEMEKAIVASVPGEAGDALRLGTLLTSGWYPVSWYRTFYAAIAGAAGAGNDLVHQLGRESARRDATGIYRLVFKLLSVQTVFSQGSRAMRMYFDRGDVTVEPGDHRAVARYDGFPGFDRNIWADLRGGGEMILELAGGKDVRWHIVGGGGDGHDHMHVEVSWK